MRTAPTGPDLLAEPRRLVTLEELRAHRQELLATAARHGVSRIRVFGSVARGEAGDESDLDLLVDMDAGRSLLDLAAFAVDVQDMIGVFTQVVTVAGLRDRIRETVLADAVDV